MSKKAIVTGAGHGIGKTIAIELAKAGYDVGITYSGSSVEQINDTLERILAAGQKGYIERMDLTDAANIKPAMDALTASLGGLDVLVNNAGATKFVPFIDVTIDQFDQLMSIDYRGTYFCAQYAARHMIAHGVKGVIINIASVHVYYNFPKASIYAPNKAAVEKLTQHIALELAPYGIRCNSVSPGYIKVTDPDSVPAREKMMVSRIPAQRIGQPVEIANMIRFLISDEAEYITGSDFLVDGGARLPALLDNVYVKQE